MRKEQRRDVAAWEARNAALATARDEKLESRRLELAAWVAQKEELLILLDPALAPPPPPPPPDPKAKGKPPPPPPEIVPGEVEEIDPRAPRSNTFDGAADVPVLYEAILAVLPELPPPIVVYDPFSDLPPPVTLQTVRRPRARGAPAAPAGFELLTLPPPGEEGEEAEEEVGEEAGGGDAGEKKAMPAYLLIYLSGPPAYLPAYLPAY